MRRLDFLELDYEGEFDGIWACASLLHLRPDELPTALSLVRRALADGGVLCMSFKRGDFSGRRDGRWYTDLEPDRMEMLAEDAGFTVIDIWDDADARGTEWVNGLFRKGPAPLDEG